ncbi:hypothetical protein [Nostoc sp.]|uniref:hypothetical protein n=1 Tax=Nostoc sp. TaxID=1180 RepID=UPI002FF495BD
MSYHSPLASPVRRSSEFDHRTSDACGGLRYPLAQPLRRVRRSESREATAPTSRARYESRAK